MTGGNFNCFSEATDSLLSQPFDLYFFSLPVHPAGQGSSAPTQLILQSPAKSSAVTIATNTLSAQPQLVPHPPPQTPTSVSSRQSVAATSMVSTANAQPMFYQGRCHVLEIVCRADSRFASSQWETALHCNDASHWLGASVESALVLSMA